MKWFYVLVVFLCIGCEVTFFEEKIIKYVANGDLTEVTILKNGEYYIYDNQIGTVEYGFTMQEAGHVHIIAKNKLTSGNVTVGIYVGGQLIDFDTDLVEAEAQRYIE